MNESNNVLELTEIPVKSHSLLVSVKEQEILNNLSSTAQHVAISSLSVYKKDIGARIEIQQELIKALENESNEVSSTFIAVFVETYQKGMQSILHCASRSKECFIVGRGKEYIPRKDPAFQESDACVNEWAAHNHAKYAALSCLVSELEIKGWKPTLSVPVGRNYRTHPFVEFYCDFSESQRDAQRM